MEQEEDGEAGIWWWARKGWWRRQMLMGQWEEDGTSRLWWGRERMVEQADCGVAGRGWWKLFFSFSFQVGREIWDCCNRCDESVSVHLQIQFSFCFLFDFCSFLSSTTGLTQEANFNSFFNLTYSCFTAIILVNGKKRTISKWNTQSVWNAHCSSVTLTYYFSSFCHLWIESLTNTRWSRQVENILMESQHFQLSLKQ